MKPFTKSTYGRDHYFYAPKEHKVPKSAKDRRGTRSAIRQLNKDIIHADMKAA